MTNASLCGEDSDADKVIRCDINFVSTFVIPALLLLATYFYGIYLFWGKQENLENLAEQVRNLLYVPVCKYANVLYNVLFIASKV